MAMVSFKGDILPLFTQMDVDHMRGFAIELDDYAFMKQPDNAQAVYDQVASGSMPPPESGEERWSEDKVTLFGDWIKGGFQP